MKNKKYLLISVGLTALLLATGIYFCTPLSDQKRIDMAITALSNMVEKDGHITYKIDFLNNKPTSGNNIVREMGTTYALAFANHQTHQPELRKKLEAVLNLARTRCIPAGEKSCFISDTPDKIKVGATALALLAELFYEKESQNLQFADIREKWLNALMDSYVIGHGIMEAPGSHETSPYFDGETWFALAVYNYLYPNNKKVADMLSSLDDTMITIYQDKYLVSFVHWGFMASAHRYATTKNDKFLTFMKKQFQLYISENPNPRAGSSTCSVSEGLGDAAYFVSDEEFVSQVLKRIERNTVKINNLQVTSKYITEKKSKKKTHIHPNTHQFIGAFKNTPNNYETRNDITQHCLTALLKRQRALNLQKTKQALKK